MKLNIKLTLATVALAAFGTTAALADDQQLENRLAFQRMQNEQATIAVYASQAGLGAAQAERPAQQYTLRQDGHGHQTGAYVSVQGD